MKQTVWISNSNSVNWMFTCPWNLLLPTEPSTRVHSTYFYQTQQNLNTSMFKLNQDQVWENADSFIGKLMANTWLVEVYLEPYQTSIWSYFAEIANCVYLLFSQKAPS